MIETRKNKIIWIHHSPQKFIITNIFKGKVTEKKPRERSKKQYFEYIQVLVTVFYWIMWYQTEMSGFNEKTSSLIIDDYDILDLIK